MEAQTMKTALGITATFFILQTAPFASASINAQPHKFRQIIASHTAMQPVLVKSKAGHCPPGLAKKAVPCVPPGQVKRYRVGDYIYDGYVRIDNPNRYGLKRNGYYVRAGNYVYEVNRQTHEVLNLIGAIADVLN
ncbi:hypothetical protein [Ruegeria atlantica]|uniref:hypothetical protein n=1 Tax=Ruegeria atlantica TaxID=81569 RepID=UPI0020C44609|nr:hypothetical protein [Ruegeria atlantica]